MYIADVIVKADAMLANAKAQYNSGFVGNSALALSELGNFVIHKFPGMTIEAPPESFVIDPPDPETPAEPVDSMVVLKLVSNQENEE